jgi:PIN domain nuclease of toxin-antitoxin system
MRILMDTHVLLWTLGDFDRLGDAAVAAIKDPENDLLFSVATIWEVAIKAGLGKRDFGVSPAGIHEQALAAGFAELPIRADAALRAGALPLHHRDPFDRLLVAQADLERATLYTADRQLLAYGRHIELV